MSKKETTALQKTGIKTSELLRRAYPVSNTVSFNSNRELSGILNPYVSPKLASTVGNPSIMYSSPQFYSPLHTPQQWQTPTRRREVYLWCRHFINNEPKVAASINFYSDFFLNSFENMCESEVIKDFFDDLCRKLDLDYWLRLTAREYWGLGDAFPFLSVECEHCGGSGYFIQKGGEKKLCRHEDGTWGSYALLNPDWIEVEQTILSMQNPTISLLPDDNLRKICTLDKYKHISSKIPKDLLYMIRRNQPIPLSNLSVTHLKCNATPYTTYGTSLVVPLFGTLMYKDMLRQAQLTVARRHVIPLRLVKVGSDSRPAGPEDIADISSLLSSVSNNPLLSLITHHAVEIDYIGAEGKILNMTNEFELITKEILDGFMINQELINGSGPSYSAAQVGAEFLIRRGENFRNYMKRFIEDRIFRPVAAMKGFYGKNKAKQDILIYPRVRWDDLEIRDDTNKNQFYMQMHEKKIISTETLCEKCNLEYDQEVERIRQEEQSAIPAIQNLGGEGAPGFGQGFAGGAGGGGLPGGLGELEMPNVPGAGTPAEGGAGGVPPVGGGGATQAPQTPTTGGLQLPRYVKPANRKHYELTSMEVNRKENEEGEVPIRTGLQKVMTKPERVLYGKIQQAQLPYVLYSQYPVPIHDVNPKRTYFIDFAFPQLKIGVEVDGEPFHSSEKQIGEDRERDKRLNQRGWTILRFRDVEVTERTDDVYRKMATTMNQKIEQIKSQGKKQHGQNTG